MRILLTNDDGIHAPGIEAMHDALADPGGELGGPIADDVLIVAPLTVQSATSHGVTFKTPLMTTCESIRPGVTGIAVDGRPADCVKLAICSLWPERFGAGEHPDLVISGLNAGANVGINVIYSGTVAAALEAAFLGVPSIAVSLHLGSGAPRFDIAARHTRRTLERILYGIESNAPSSPLGRHECVSINIPVCQDEPIDPPTPDEPEICVCPMNTHGLVDAYERRQSPAGQTYYWSSGSGLDFHGADVGTDVHHLFQRQITVTPLKYDLTQHEAIELWKAHLSAGASAH